MTFILQEKWKRKAGTYAPNAGGGQRSIIVEIRNAELAEKIGRLNVAHCFVLLGYCKDVLDVRSLS